MACVKLEGQAYISAKIPSPYPLNEPYIII